MGGLDDAAAAWAPLGRQVAAAIVDYDHHRVRVGGRWGVLITYHLLPLEEAREPLRVRVVFDPSPEHRLSPAQIRAVIQRHPPAPAEVQAAVDGLSFRPGQGDTG